MAGDRHSQGPMARDARDARGEDEPVVRDAAAIAERIARDEAAADAARERYRSEELPLLEPGSLAPLLHPGEWLHTIHRLAMLETSDRREEPAPNERPLPHGGTLYLTSQRLIHRGTQDASWGLVDIDEMSVSLERLLLVQLRDGSDLAIEVDQPRLLRVQLAAAIAALRANAVLEGNAGAGVPAPTLP